VAAADPGFHPEAASEYEEAAAWYGERNLEVAVRFHDAVQAAVARIAEAPERWPRLDDTHRKLTLRRFPYLIVYRDFEGRLWIVAVAHGHRRPGYWRDRSLKPGDAE
jgi:plasmid stabilization system protein ParE